MPLGILNAIDARRTSLELLPGDVVIMVSDGVTDAGLGAGIAAEMERQARGKSYGDSTANGAEGDGADAVSDATDGSVQGRLSDSESPCSPGRCGGEPGEDNIPHAAEWLEDVLSLEWDDDLDVMSRRIIGRAQSVGGRDDLSVILVRVEDYA